MEEYFSKPSQDKSDCHGHQREAVLLQPVAEETDEHRQNYVDNIFVVHIDADKAGDDDYRNQEGYFNFCNKRAGGEVLK